MQTVSPKLEDKVVNMLIEIGGNKNAGAMEAIQAYTYLRRATWQELQGRFTNREAWALVDMYNGTLLTPDLQYQTSVLRAQIEDAELYDGTVSKHSANRDEMLAKTDSLTAAQVWFLQQELVRAWEKNLTDNKAIESLVAHLSVKPQ